MDEQQLRKKIAYLEFVNDQLDSEIQDLDLLMKAVGFKEGIATVKATAQEIYQQGYEEFEE